MAENVKSLKLIDRETPTGSSGGTGYDEYFIFSVEYESGRTQTVRVGYYYQNFNQVFINLYDALFECGNPQQVHSLLLDAIISLQLCPFLSYSELPKKYQQIKNPQKRKIYRIRKLTPRECFRLMGVSDDDISKIQNYPLVPDGMGGFEPPANMTIAEMNKLTISESQQYKIAGNSIVVQVLEGIFTQMFSSEREEGLTLFG